MNPTDAAVDDDAPWTNHSAHFPSVTDGTLLLADDGRDNGTANGELAGRVATGIGLYLLALVTCVGNGMVIHAIRTEKRLRKVSNLFIMSLAVADLVVGVFVMPIGAVYVLTDRWVLGVWMCDAWLSIDYCASTASILNLFVLSLDRYWSITSPLKYLRRRTKKRAFYMIAAAWALSFMWILPVTGWHSMINAGGVKQNPPGTCDTEFADNIAFKVTAAVANFYVPTLAMIYIYGRIFRTIRKRGRKDLGATGGMRKSTDHEPTAATAATGEYVNGGGSLLSRSTSLFTRWHHGKFRWCRSAPGALQAHNGSSSRETAPGTLHCFQSLTLLELHGGKDEASHYSGIRVSVEYVGDDDHNQRHDDELVAAAAVASVQKPVPDRKPPIRTSNSSNALGSGPTSRIIAQSERKAARQLGVIMCAFIVCWLPYFIVFLVVAACPDCVNGTLSKVTLWLGYINSTLNPVLYPLCNANFRHAFGRIMSNTCCPSVWHQRQAYPVGGQTVAPTQRY